MSAHDSLSRDASSRQWSRIKAVFSAASALPPEARARYLDEACGEDRELRSRVLALLHEDQQPQPFLDGPAADRLAKILRLELEGERCRELIGQRLGSYRVLRPIGKGGESTVYLGERDDGQFQQRVAIKVLEGAPGFPGGQAGEGALERQILTRLNHPAIARLYDAGVTGTGRPYFVMEWVEGRPIDAFCEDRRLSVARSLELFLEVCSAVQHAHRSLVVHSDLKPGNILVTAEGRPKLLDFGIARLQGAAVFAHGSEPGRRALTPAYASPEQRRGETLTVASDVYSLGVLLYRLLAGSLPREAPPGSTSRDPGPGEPLSLLPPSRAVVKPAGGEPGTAREGTAPDRRAGGASPGLARRLAGDLDAIVLKALAPDPAQRYPSVAELAADLRSHLERRPVAARGRSWLYRGDRWLRRRWWLAAGLLLGLGVLVSLALQELRLHRALTLARQEQTRAAAVTEFLDRLLAASRPDVAPGEELSVRRVLDHASRALSVELAHQPEVQARLLGTLGSTYQTLGHLERAEESLEAALRLQRHVAGDGAEATAASLDRLAGLRLQQGRLGDAETLQRESLAIRRALHGPRHLAVAESLNNLGEILRDGGDLEGAQELLEQSASLRRSLVGTEHRAYLESLFELGLLYRDRGDTLRATRAFREGLPLARRLLGEDHLDTLQLTHDLAFLLRGSDQQGLVESLYHRAAEGYRKVLGEEHPWTSTATRNLARLLREQGRFGEAEGLLIRVLEIQRRRTPGDPVYTAYVEEDLGRLHLKAGAPDTAAGHLSEALGLLRSHLPAEDWRIANTRSIFGECLTRLGRFEEAESHLLEALPVLEQRFGPDGDRTVKTRQRLEEARQAAGPR